MELISLYVFVAQRRFIKNEVIKETVLSALEYGTLCKSTSPRKQTVNLIASHNIILRASNALPTLCVYKLKSITHSHPSSSAYPPRLSQL